MKKTLALLLVIMLAIGLAGCGDGDSAANGDFKDPYEAYGLKP